MRTPRTSLPTIAIELDDASIAEIRPILPGDRDLITEGLAHMSMQSRIARFGTGIGHFTESELEYLTHLDLVDHVAWGALVGGRPAGTSRYIRSGPDAPAEMAVAVVDAFQRRGLGRVLFDALLSSARRNGVGELTFAIQPENRSVLAMVSGVQTEMDDSQGLIVGRLKPAEVDPGPYEAEISDLLEWYQARVGA